MCLLVLLHLKFEHEKSMTYYKHEQTWWKLADAYKRNNNVELTAVEDRPQISVIIVSEFKQIK